MAFGQALIVPLDPFGLRSGIEAANGAASLPKGHFMSSRTDKIRSLNDSFRQSLVRGGQCVITSGVAALGSDLVGTVLNRVRTFDAFTADNDPYGEHDFGAFRIGMDRFFWKIDYYDETLAFGSEDPAEANKTRRVLTIMLAEEY